MVEGQNIQIEGFDELQKKLSIQLPSMVRKMAFAVDANVAALGRGPEQSEAGSLEMGKPQRKGDKPYKTYSRWDNAVGWVSTEKTYKGGGSYRLSSFSWAPGTKGRKDSVVAHYSSRLANLWANRSKTYTKNSPLVGQPGRLTYWKAGTSRPSMYSWSTTANVLNRMIDSALAKTEQKFASELKEM